MKNKLNLGLVIFFLLVLATSISADPYKSYMHAPSVSPNIPVQDVQYVDKNSGAAVYSYNIEVPPGTNSLQPKISLSYNSHAKNSYPELTGSAWSLSESYIQRDVKYTPSSTTDDKFILILNGAPLKLENIGSNEYKTEIETYLYIKHFTSSDYWIVKTKDGTSYRFGYTQDSELNSNTNNYVWRWYLDTVTDTHENKIYYSYLSSLHSDDIGVKYLDEITYNNNEERRIEFDYETLTRRWIVYQEGQKVRRSMRLSEIKTYADNIRIKKYHIDYVFNDPTAKTREYISSIIEYGKVGSNPLPPTTFEYSNFETGWERNTELENKLPSSARFAYNGMDGATRAADIDRDGLVDLISNGHVINTISKAVYLKQKNESFEYTPSYNPVDDARFIDTINSNPDFPHDNGVRLGDFNGDGYVDLIRGFRDDDNDNYYQMWENTGTGWSLSSRNFITIFNEVNKLGSNDYESEPKGVEIVDLDGDGDVDVLRSKEGLSKRAWINTGTSWQIDSNWNVPSPIYFLDSGEDDEGTRLIDINGDGLTDIYQSDKYSNDELRLNTGEGWISSTTHATPGNFVDNGGDDQGYRFADVNNDGLVDLLYAEEEDRNTWLNTGSGWALSSNWEIPVLAEFVKNDGENEGTRLFDANVDGAVDIVRIDSTNGAVSKLAWTNKGIAGNLLKKVIIPTGGEIHFAYNNSKDISNNEMGFNMWIVEKIGTSSKMGSHSESNDYFDCIPDACPVGSIDLGVTCSGSTCNRDCAIQYCGSYTNVLDYYEPWSEHDFNGEWGKPIQSYSNFQDNYCYIVTTGSDDNIIDDSYIINDDEDNCQAAIALSWRHTGSTLQTWGGDCLADTTGYLLNKKHYYLIDDDDPGDDFNSAEDLEGEWTGYCRPPSIGCGGVSDPCTTECYGTTWRYWIEVNPCMDDDFEKGDPSHSLGACNSDDGSGPDMGSIDFENNKYVWMAVDEAPLTTSYLPDEICQRTPVSLTTYDYNGGLYDYDDKEFRGFEKVNETLPDESKILHNYHQDDYYKGLEEERNLLDENENLIKKTEYDYSHSINSNGINIVKLDWVQDTFYNSSDSFTTKVEFNYDSYGNIEETKYHGDILILGDEKFETTYYVYNLTNWIINTAWKTELKDENEFTIGYTLYSYDYQFNGDPPIKGDVTKIQYYDGSTPFPEENFEYNFYGNINEYTNKNGKNYIYTYDSSQTFVETETNPLSHVQTYDYDLGTGNLLSVTDTNNFITTYEYDDYGRIKKEIQEYDSSSSPTKEYQYDLTNTPPSKITELSKIDGSNYHKTNTYLDGLGREVQKKIERTASNDFQNIDYYYDEKGRMYKVSNPYLKNNGNYHNPSNGIAKTISEFDTLGRITKVINPDSTFKTIDYNLKQEKTIDENGNKKETIKDTYGNIINIKEFNEGEIYSTNYEYDTRNLLTNINDNENNNLEYTYDVLGRKTSLIDWDLGIKNYTYDNENNLIEQRDSENNIVSFVYDDLGRLTEKDTNENIIEYTYDSNLLGTLSSIEDSNFEKEFYYDNRYRNVHEIQNIDNLEFHTYYNYNSMNLVTNKTLPNGEIIAYDYYKNSLLKSIEEVISNIKYNKFLNPINITYNSGIYTIKNYDPNTGRIEYLKTQKPNNQVHQLYGYEYDNKGNIEQISNYLVTNDEYNYSYDNLDRLIKSSKEDEYLVEYDYNSIGNMLSVDYYNIESSPELEYEINYDYGNNPVHSPSSLTYYSPLNIAPTATYNPEGGGVLLVNEVETLTVTAVDLDNDSLTYSWEINNVIMSDYDNIYDFSSSEYGAFNVTSFVSDGTHEINHTWEFRVITEFMIINFTDGSLEKEFNFEDKKAHNFSISIPKGATIISAEVVLS